MSFTRQEGYEMALFARRPEAVTQWLAASGLSGTLGVSGFHAFNVNECFDAIINFVGSGDPAQTLAMGASILDVTQEYDTLALNYLRQHPKCRYLFLSSGTAYGAVFSDPVDRVSKAVVPINDLQPQDWYAAAKLYAECRHRSLADKSIFDIRVFNYFSRSQDINARFLISDILRAIRDKSVLKVSPGDIVRDFLHPSDFHALVVALLSAPAANTAVDCYSLKPVTKSELLNAMREEFALRYEVTNANSAVNATGSKPNYYSMNRRARDFGYCPSLTSLEGVMKEAAHILDGWK
jgi:nucleoside-diphosphate-sugar epimerase